MWEYCQRVHLAPILGFLLKEQIHILLSKLPLMRPDELPDLQGSGVTFSLRLVTVKGVDMNIIEHQGQEV